MTISYETPKRLDGESMFEYRRREARLFWNYRLDAIKAMAEGGDTVGAITRLAEMLRQPEPADDTVRPSTGKAEPPTPLAPCPHPADRRRREGFNAGAVGDKTAVTRETCLACGAILGEPC